MNVKNTDQDAAHELNQEVDLTDPMIHTVI